MSGFKVCAVTAFVTSLSATVTMAVAANVIIIDPQATTRAARVEAGNRLAVQDVPPTSFFHLFHLGFAGSDGCQPILSAGTRAVIVRQITLNTYANPTPGNGGVDLYQGSSCTGDVIAVVDLPSLGPVVLPFEPGVTVPANASVSARVFGSIGVHVWVDGYTVPAGVAAAARPADGSQPR